MDENELQLTPEQEQKLLECWNKTPESPPSFSELTLAVFGEEHDGRDKFGRAIKKALMKHSLKAKSKTTYETKTDKFELDEEQKLFVKNNLAHMSPVDISRVLYKDPSLSNLNAQTKAIVAYINQLDTRVIFNGDNKASDVPMEDYKPPKTLDAVLKRVNTYVNFVYEKDKLTSKQKKDLETLINYLHTFRLTKQVNNYDREDDRKSFEDAFIRYTYDKCDLTQEEVDQYIMLAHEVVISFKIQRRVESLQNMLEDTSNADGGDRVKISMSLVEAINSAQKEYDDCVDRQQHFLSDLKQKRSARLSKDIKDNAVILNILNAWRQEETRKDFLVLAEKEQKAVAGEVQHISDMEDFKARILGLTKDEILNG